MPRKKLATLPEPPQEPEQPPAPQEPSVPTPAQHHQPALLVVGLVVAFFAFFALGWKVFAAAPKPIRTQKPPQATHQSIYETIKEVDAKVDALTARVKQIQSQLGNGYGSMESPSSLSPEEEFEE